MEKLYPFGFFGHVLSLLNQYFKKPQLVLKTAMLCGLLFTCSTAATFAGTGGGANFEFAATKSQTITFKAITAKTYGAADFAPGATASSGLVITYTSGNSAIATIVSGKIHIIKSGTVVITASQVGNATYKTAPAVTQTLTINKAKLTITAAAKTKVYGAAVPALTFTYSGFVNGDNSISTKPTIKTTAIAASHVGSYPITLTGAADADYTITAVNSTLAVTPAKLTITAAAKTKVYGAALPALTFTYSGFVSGETSITTKPTIKTSATAVSHMANYPITLTGAADADYTITLVNSTIAVTPAKLTITAAAKTKVYGAALPALTFTYSGFVNGDNSITTKPTITTTATAASHVNTYPITLTGAADADYTITYSNAKVTVTQAPLSITAEAKSKSDGAANPALTVIYKGFVNGDNSIATPPVVSTTATATSAPGTYPINVTGAADADYKITQVAGVLTVKDVAFSFAAIPAKTYGTADFSPGAVGELNITYTSSNPDVASIVSNKVHISNIGSVVITAKSGSKTLTQPLTINKAPITVTVAAKTKVYGAEMPNLTATYTGFVNGDGTDNIEQAMLVTNAKISSPVGSTYTITASGASAARYSFIYVGAKFTVTKAPLTVTASNLTMSKGGPIPTITSVYTGFVNGDNADDLTTKPTYTYTFTATSAIGTYPITPKGTVGSNYTITHVAGTMSIIDPASVPPVISYGPSKTLTAVVAVTPFAPTHSGNAIVGTGKTVTTIAGSGSHGSANGTGTAASFYFTFQNMMAVDKTGNIYIADQENYRIRKITPAGVVSNFAGSGSYGDVNGTGAAAKFGQVRGIVTDAAGNIYINDAGNKKIKKITPAGVVTTLAGKTQILAKTDGTGSAATFSQLTDITIDGAGVLYVLDHEGEKGLIRKVTTAGVITTLVENTQLQATENLVIDKAGNFYTSGYDYIIRKIQPNGTITNFVGYGGPGAGDGTGTGAGITISQGGMEIDKYGDIYFSDIGARAIRRITPAGVVTTVVGTGLPGSKNGTLDVATFSAPADVVFDATGNMYIADQDKFTIRKVSFGGYTISPKLPAGLVFNSATGAVSGTPLVSAAQRSYTVTAYGDKAYGTAILNLKVLDMPAPSISYAAGVSSLVEGTSASISLASTGSAVIPDTNHVVSTYAGSGTFGSANGPAKEASFTFGYFGFTAADKFGNVYVSDQGSNSVRKIDVNGNVTTLAGSGTAGDVNAVGTAASFNIPSGLAVDSKGNVYVVDKENRKIKKITADGTVTTLAGSGSSVAADGVGIEASFNNPIALAIDKNNLLYVTDSDQGFIKNVNITTGQVTTKLSGNEWRNAVVIAVDNLYNLYTAGFDSKVTKTNMAGATAIIAGASYATGYRDGDGGSARFNTTLGLAVDNEGNVYVGDTGNNRVRKITPFGEVSTFAGTGAATNGNGNAAGASISFPTGLAAVDGVLYVLDGNANVRKITTPGFSIKPGLPGGLAFNLDNGTIMGTPTAVSGPVEYNVTAYNAGGTSVAKVTIAVANSSADTVKISTIAGNGTRDFVGDGGLAKDALLVSPYGMATDSHGNIYMATSDSRIRKIDHETKNITTIAGTGEAGYSGDGGPATAAAFNVGLTGLAVDAMGNVYVGDYNNHRIRKIDANTQEVTTFAGTGNAGNSGDGGEATNAEINNPAGVTVDTHNNVYFVDYNNNRIRKVDAETHVITTVVGGGNSTADGTDALSYRLGNPERFVFDKHGNMLIANESGANVLKVSAEDNSVSIIAGVNGFGEYSGDGGLATEASITSPLGIAVDTADNVYVVDQAFSVIRKIDAVTKIISTYAGTGVAAYTGDGGRAVEASINFSTDIAFDDNQNLLISDYVNNAIRKIGSASGPTTAVITFAEIPAKTYGDADFDSGAVNDAGAQMEGTSSNESVATITNGTIHITGVGTTTITATVIGNANTNGGTSASQTFTVLPAPLIATADTQTKADYDSSPVTATISYAGFVNGEDASVFTNPGTTSIDFYENSAGATAYTITVSGIEAANYTITYQTGLLYILHAPSAQMALAKKSTDVLDQSVDLKVRAALSPNGDGVNNALDQSVDPKVSSALSPNGDGFNDVLKITNIENYPQNRLVLVNRSGDKVFEATGYDNSYKVFDGHSNLTGKMQQPGTYFYTLEYTQKGVVKRKTGFVVIK